MIAYPDTSFLCSIYRKQIHTPLALAYIAQMTEPLHFTRLLEFEFLQAIELQVWLHSSDPKKGYTRREADQMIDDWESDIASGLNKLVPCDSDAVLRLAGFYSEKHTARSGHRSLDILHVATAVHLGAKEFLTFDERQRSLARRVGLKLAV
ncbi:MAG: type II toxin-antitoxin system VapC family toxin [bacterium]